MSTDAKGTKILARTFFNQLKQSGYTPHQIIGVATELIDLVAAGIREGEGKGSESRKDEVVPAPAAKSDFRQAL